MDKVAEYSFSLNIRVLKIIGLYPSNSHKILNKIYSHAMYCLAMVPVAILSTFHFVFIYNFTGFSYDDFIMAAMPFYIFKFLPFVLDRNKIQECIHYFDDPYYIVVTEKHKEIMEKCVRACRRNSNVFFAGCMSALTTILGPRLLNFQQLPINVWIPKFVEENVIYYSVVYFLVVLGSVYPSLACSTIDPLIGGLAYQAAAQLQILKQNLQNLDSQMAKLQYSSPNKRHLSVNSKKVYVKIKRCVRRYQKLLVFVRLYQDCFSPVVFSQLTGSGLVIGLLCYRISKVLVLDVSALIMINYIALVIFQIFFYCYYGTLLSEESKTLPTAIYLSRWYEYNIKCQKALSILMEQSQKPIVVTAGKLFELSIETFMMVLKRSYSLLAILRNY